VQDKFKVKACFDIDKEKVGEVSEIYEAEPCLKLESLLASPEVGLVLVCTKPASTHTEIGLAALDAGKNVLLEKPMCGTRGEGEKLIKKASETGKILTVYQSRRWDPEFVCMRWAVEQGYFGDVKLFESLVCGNLLNANWLFDWGVHLIDQALTICGGRPIEVTCVSAGDPENESGPWFAMIRFDNGKTALATMRAGMPGDYPRYSVIGDKGAAAWPSWNGTMKDKIFSLEMPPIRQGKGKDSLTLGVREIPFTPFYHNLYDVLEGKAELAVKPEEALTVVDVALAAMESSKKKQAVML
jgi:predicted dehydrogenase